MAPHGRVGLGHARLSIIDLTTGDQPIASEDERAADRRQRRVLRLRADPARARAARATGSGPGRTARSRCTSTRTSAPHCLQQLARRVRVRRSGTRPNQTLFAARDRFGIKPLFYAVHDGDAVPRLRGEGAVRGRRARPLESQNACSAHDRCGGHPDRDAVSTASPRSRPATTCSPRAATRSCIATGTSTIPPADRQPPCVPDAEYAERLPRTRSTRRCACGCAPTCRSAAT